MSTTSETFTHPAFGPCVRVRHGAQDAVVVALHGAQVVSWKTASDEAGHPPVERLFVSSLATTRSAIRGGIPVCFPQFAGLGPLPKHGFARTTVWRHSGGGRFVLDVPADLWPGFPFPCALIIDVTIGPRTLTVSLTVDNVGPSELSFTGALHTYLAVPDVRMVRVDGFADSPVTFDREVDLNFGGVAEPGLVSSDGVPTMLCAQTGFADAVVWNIGSSGAAGIADLGRGEWANYVCVEAACLRPVTVSSQSRWTGTQTLVALTG